MTMIETTKTTSAGIIEIHEVPLVAWEPCAAYTDADLTEPGCRACGWLADDHEIEVEAGAEHSGADAIVVTLPGWMPLRRAS